MISTVRHFFNFQPVFRYQVLFLNPPTSKETKEWAKLVLSCDFSAKAVVQIILGTVANPATSTNAIPGQ